MSGLLAWVEDRTGAGSFVKSALYEHIPGGARWRYVWGSTLVFAFAVQAITGIVLWSAYSPSQQTAWESVYYIQHEMTAGWLLRGLHHYMAQAMIVLLALHFLQVVIDGAYRAPREVNFWLGLLLMGVVLKLALTGYLLPWDQKGYWATKVATSLAGLVPVIGPQLQRIAVGGADYGHLTLTRFFAAHAGLFPAALVGLLVLHIAVFRRHGVKHPDPAGRPDAYFWPDQVFRDAVACFAVMAVVLGFAVYRPVELFAPADPSQAFSAARPEWYFLFLFQMLKLPVFAGENEVWGAIGVPAAIGLFIAAMPLVGRWKLGHRFNIAFTFALLACAAGLTAMAIRDDAAKPEYHEAIEAAEHEAKRASELASAGIPPEGALYQMRHDPYLQGPKLFTRHCLSCHSHDSGDDGEMDLVADEVSAPNLAGFGTAAWVSGLLDAERIAAEEYFGATAHAEGEMVGFVQFDLAELEDSDRAAIAAALAAESGLGESLDEETVEFGRELIVEVCIDCHRFGEDGDLGAAPDLTGYASREWLLAFLANPGHERFYGDNNDRMPAFGADELLSQEEIGLVVDWIRGDWFRAEQQREPAEVEPAEEETAAEAP